MNLPRLLLVTDSSLDASSGGINRTLVNLFEGYPREKMLVHMPKAAFERALPLAGFRDRIVTYEAGEIKVPRNRIGAWFGPFLERINLERLSRLPEVVTARIHEFDPELMLVVPNSIACSLVARRIGAYLRVPSVVYAMDDWRGEEHKWWFTGNARKVLESNLREAAGWIVISARLREAFEERYGFRVNRSLELHNPVQIDMQEEFEPKERAASPFRIVYAGSLWAMHLDALHLIAEAVMHLRTCGVSIELCVHTDEAFWNTYRDVLTKKEVVYGGHLAYDDLRPELKRADLLLVASSFSDRERYLTETSVQTKLTDYLAAGRPLLACGPSYSACNLFVRRWQCGFCWEDQDSHSCASFLDGLRGRPEQLAEVGACAFETARMHFESRQVCARLYSFLAEMAGTDTDKKLPMAASEEQALAPRGAGEWSN